MIWTSIRKDTSGQLFGERTYSRPYGDFHLILIDYAQEHYYVIEGTAKSYARIALKPFEHDLWTKWKYKRANKLGLIG